MNRNETHTEKMRRWKRESEAADPEYEKAAIELIKKIPYLTKEACHQAMLEMDRKWPGRGWKREANECLAKRKAMKAPKSDTLQTTGEVIQDTDLLPF